MPLTWRTEYAQESIANPAFSLDVPVRGERIGSATGSRLVRQIHREKWIFRLSVVKILSEHKSDRHRSQERLATMSRRAAACTISGGRVIQI